MQTCISNLFSVKRYAVGFRFLLSILLLAFALQCSQAEYLTHKENGKSWVVVEQDQAPIYSEANRQSMIKMQAARSNSLEVIEQPNEDWFKVYLDDSHQQAGFIHKGSLFKYYYRHGDLVAVAVPGSKTILTEYEETSANTAVEIYNQNQRIDRIESPYPFSRYDSSWGSPVALSGVDFVYQVSLGVPACAEPFTYLYFSWNGKELKLLETGCLLCQNADYAIKEIILPSDASQQDTVLVKYSWGKMNDYDGIDIEMDFIERYQWDGTRLKFVDHNIVKHRIPN